jgi:catechol 2,3-dioxygenase-like lactoylglutathione lyase family enzyme
LSLNARFVHVNLIACNWQALSCFYQQVFGCIPVPPQRDLSGSALEAGTGLPGAHLQGEHLRLPGGCENGPTLEIFSYIEMQSHPAAAVNRPGYGHIAFVVEDVSTALAAVLAAGGSSIGEIVTTRAGSAGLTWCYAADPEGNILELQAWHTN